MQAARVLVVKDMESGDSNTLQLLQRQEVIKVVFVDDLSRIIELVNGGLPFDVVITRPNDGRHLQQLSEVAGGKVLILVDAAPGNESLADQVNAMGQLVRPFGPADLLQAIRDVANSEKVRRDPLSEAVAGKVPSQSEVGVSPSLVEDARRNVTVIREATAKAISFIQDTYDVDSEPEALAALRLLEVIATPSLDRISQLLELLAAGKGNPVTGQSEIDAHSATLSRIMVSIHEHAPKAIVQVLAGVGTQVVLKVLGI